MIKAILTVLPVIPLLLISAILYYTHISLHLINQKVMRVTDKYMTYYKIQK